MERQPPPRKDVCGRSDIALASAVGPASAARSLHDEGYAVIHTVCSPSLREKLKSTVFAAGEAGSRCLLDRWVVREAAEVLRDQLRRDRMLPGGAVAVQAIAFDKSPTANWKVPWHQDLLFPMARTVTASGYTLPGVKDGVPYARPPLAVLESLLAVRLHLDRCGEDNGPLRVSPRTHRLGVLPSDKAAETAVEHGSVTCLAGEGDAVLMKPLALHASSQARRAGHRRVLHLVFHAGDPVEEPWHRAV